MNDYSPRTAINGPVPISLFFPSTYTPAMPRLSRNSSQNVEDLRRHSAKIGKDIWLVQGPAGNISLKSDDVMWIKSSGTRLKDALDSEIFVGLDLITARALSLSESQDFSSCVVEQSPKGLRPSIETAMHLLIDAPCVTHVHSLGSIAKGIQDHIDEALALVRSVVQVSYVPYAQPGVKLARAVRESLGPSTQALLLGNHGLTLWGDDFSEIEALLQEIESLWRMRNPSTTIKESSPTSKRDSWWSSILCEGVLSPDEAVLLYSEGVINGNEIPTSSPFRLNSEGYAELISPCGRDGQDVVTLLRELGAHVDVNAPINFLTEEDVSALLNWDIEKMRRAKSQ